MDRTDRTLIIGAGPGGLSAAAAMKARGVPFDIVDAGRQVGGIWDIDRPETPMYDAAHFISSRTQSGLRDFPMPEEYPDYPRHDQILRYIQAFAGHHHLTERVEFGTRVIGARPEDGGTRWHVSLDNGDERSYGALCVATGTTWHPSVPELPGTFEGDVYHAFHFRSAREFEGKRVLVVGGGNSGCDIACEAARSADRAFISLSRGYHFVPKYVFGMPADVFAHAGPRLPGWLEERVFGFLIGKLLVGDLTRYGLPKPDHRILQSHPIMNTQILHYLGHGDLEVRPDVQRLEAGSVVFTDGSEEAVDVVVLATGYERIFPFLAGGGEGGTVEPRDLYLDLFHRRHPTLFFVGLFETDGAAYEIFGLQAEVVAGYLADRARGGKGARRLDELRVSHRPDLTGGRRYLPSRRHEHYVRGAVYVPALKRLAGKLGRL
jgi:cation diffusion facilitator CzcD-associated flavoprotein CzcO